MEVSVYEVNTKKNNKHYDDCGYVCNVSYYFTKCCNK